MEKSSLKQIQKEHGRWAAMNFPDSPAYHPLLGLVEEVGELSHHFLKREQNIRTFENHDKEIRDALGDIIIYLCHFANTQNIDIDTVALRTWYEVKKRNWIEDSERAHVGRGLK